MSDLQKQIAGDNSTQIQASGNIIINNSGGITTETAIEIYKSLFERDKALCVSEAVSKATERVNSLLDKLMGEILKLKEKGKILEAFEDPAFQALLMNAQKSAACSENETSIDILTELIISRVNKGDNVQNRIGINHAIEIIDQVDADSLCALTVLYAVENYIYTTGDPIVGLKQLDKLYRSLIQQELPCFDKLRLDGLDILKIIRINITNNFRKFDEYFPSGVLGYSSAGIAKNSKEYSDAQEILKDTDVASVLVDNVFMPGYVRLNVVDEEHLDKIKTVAVVDGINTFIPIKAKDAEALHKVWGLYTKDQKINKTAAEAFMKEADSLPAIKQIHEWWDSFPYYFDITRTGSAIAYANAKRISSGLPELPF